jgi:hypothetical protein
MGGTEMLPVIDETPFRGVLVAALERQSGSTTGELAGVLPALLRPAHSSLPVAPAADRRVWGIESGNAHAPTLEGILKRSEDELADAWPVPLASAAARVHRDGDREGWESVAFARQRRLSRAAVAAAVTLDDRWIDEVADGVVLLCEQSSWCWPAHDDSMRVHGAVLATATDPFLDLGAGEVAAQLAWIDQLLGAQLDARYPGLRERVRREVRARVLDPFVRRRDWHWLGLDGDVHNWNPWIHGNVLVAALRLLDAPHEETDRAHVVALALEGLDRYVTSLPEDGAIDEGYAYWWNGACRALEALDVLAHATDGRLDPTASIPALRETVAFPHRMHLGDDWYLNLADGQAKPPRDQAWHSLHRAARRVGDTAAQSHAASHRTADGAVASEAEGLGRLLRGVTDPHWIEAEQSTPPLPRDVWLASTQVLLARTRVGDAAGLALAVKGGHNAEHHNHNDVGSFLVATGGVPVVVDAGRPTYTLATFGPERYAIWTMQSSWHNVPEIRGVSQPAGTSAAASGIAVEIDDDRAMLGLELAGAYPAPGLRSWRRSVRLDRDASRVTIDDAWDLAPWAHGVEPATTVHLLLAGDVLLGDGEALITPLDGAPAVRLRWPFDVGARMTVRSLDDPILSDVWGPSLTRLELDVTNRSAISVTVEPHLPTEGNER